MTILLGLGFAIEEAEAAFTEAAAVEYTADCCYCGAFPAGLRRPPRKKKPLFSKQRKQAR